MKKIIALLLVAVMCLAVVGCNSGNNSQNPNDNANSGNGGNNSHKDILGDWFSANSKDTYVKFFDDGTGELKDGMIFDFEWEYDSENENYRASVAGRRITFKMRTEEGITFLTGFGYFFREKDCETALAVAKILRANYVDRQLKGESLLPFGEDILLDKVSIVFEQINLSEDKKDVIVKISVTAKSDVTSSELNNLLTKVKYHYFYEDFRTLSSVGSGTLIKISENDLVSGETINTEFSICSGNDIQVMVNNSGKLDGYAIIKCGETEYYINLGEYTKQ